MGKVKKAKIKLFQETSKNIKNFIWCQNPKCLESTKLYKNNKELEKHIKSHTSTFKNPKIHSVINQYENEQYEYKYNINSSPKDKICQTIVAMANCIGGYIYFGISDNRIIYGINKSCDWDKYMLEIANNLKYHSKPTIPIIKSNHINLNKDYKLFYIEVLYSKENDFRYKDKKYLRCLSSNQFIEYDYTYKQLINDNKNLNNKIKELEEELLIKDKYIENILKTIN